VRKYGIGALEVSFTSSLKLANGAAGLQITLQDGDARCRRGTSPRTRAPHLHGTSSVVVTNRAVR